MAGSLFIVYVIAITVMGLVIEGQRLGFLFDTKYFLEGTFDIGSEFLFPCL